MNTCLIDGQILGYDAAYTLDSTAEIADVLEYLGEGYIHRIKGHEMNDGDRLRFYRIKNNRKHNLEK